MKWRVIVTMSLDHDDSSNVTNNVAGAFEREGIKRGMKDGKKTGSYEGEVTPDSVAAALANVIRKLESASRDSSNPATLDHLWIYIDRADDCKIPHYQETVSLVPEEEVMILK
jgi:hypothetical protein